MKIFILPVSIKVPFIPKDDKISFVRNSAHPRIIYKSNNGMVQPGTTIGHREDPNLVQILKEDQTGVLGPQAEVDSNNLHNAKSS